MNPRKTRGGIFLAAVGIWSLALFGLIGGVPAEEKVQLSSLDPQELTPVKIHQLMRDPASQQPVVLLTDTQEERAILIWIGPYEAEAISAELQGVKHPRPLTHDLLEKIIQKLNGRVQRVVITHVQENTYHATITLERGGTPIEIDARPSDSLVLALKFKAPVFVSKNLFKERGIAVTEKKGVEEKYGLTLQELTSMLAESFSYKSTSGVLVAAVQKDSQAEKDGLKRGDIFVEVGGESTGDIGALQKILVKSKPPVTARIFREGGFLTITLHLK